MNSALELVGLLSISLVFLFYVFCRSEKKLNNSKKTTIVREAPEIDGAWPIIGHLHLLGGGNCLPYRALGAMADEYGPAFCVRLGSHRAFVVSSWQVAKECFTLNDKALANRPETAGVKHMCYNNAVFGLAPYTPYWHEMRKIVILKLLSHHRLDLLKHVRSTEINFTIKELYGRWASDAEKSPALVELGKCLELMMLNIILRMVVGKRYSDFGAGSDEGGMYHKATTDFSRLMGVFVLSDAIPFLSWLDLQGHEKQMKKTGKDLDLVLTGWLEEHRQRRKSGLAAKVEDEQDFMDEMLSLEEEGQLSNFQHDSDTVIKSTCLGLTLGSRPIGVTLTWAFSLLLNHPNVLKKVQQELDHHIGTDRQVDESDVKDLVYLQAVVKEVLRLYPADPLLSPREAIEDCSIAGYNIKAGTRLIVNVWKLQRDPTVWADPSEFQPERFLGPVHGDIQLKGQEFVLMPFGTGRRSCPAYTFALQVLHLTLARLLHAFDLGQPGGRPVDMNESRAMSVPKVKPLEVLLTPRLPSKLYGC